MKATCELYNSVWLCIVGTFRYCTYIQVTTQLLIINEDTCEGQVDNPLTLNLYTYVLNNPLRYMLVLWFAHESRFEAYFAIC